MQLVNADAARWQNPASVEIARKHLARPFKEESYGRWQDWAVSMRADAARLETPIEVLHHAQKSISFDHREVVRHTHFLEIYHALVCTEFPWFEKEIDRQSDDKMSLPETMGLRGDTNLVSNIFFWHLRSMLACLSHVGKPKRIMEIGGGYGALARLWLQNEISPLEEYVILDIPEALFFSEVYLRTLYPGEVAYFGEEDCGKARIVLVPIDLRNNWKIPADIVISTGSMQEMSPYWVREWMNWLDQSDSTHCYSLNYTGQMYSALYESRNLWAPTPSPQWRTIAFDPDPPLVAMMSASRSFCEFMYERSFPARTVLDWPVLRGSRLTRRSYIEGLDLVRQMPTRSNIALFLDTCYEHLSRLYGGEPKDLYKEMVVLAQILCSQGDERGRKVLDLVAKLPPINLAL